QQVHDPRLGRDGRDRTSARDRPEDVRRHALGAVVAAAVDLDQRRACLGRRQRPAHGGGGGDRRVDDPRAHGGDRDAVRAKLLAQRLGEAEDGELGRAVGGELGGGEEAGGRGDVHHVPAAAAPHHPGEEEVAAVDYASECDREVTITVLERVVVVSTSQPPAAVDYTQV